MYMRLASLALTVAAVALVACSDKTTGVANKPLAGLSLSETNDTTVSPPPDTSTWTPQPGSFHGVVFHPGAGPDTIGTAIRVANVAIVVYPQTGWNGSEPQLGDPVASFSSNANGEFQAPTIDGGPYIVTFTPPADSPYRGVYVQALVYNESNSGQWWISLPSK